MFRQSGSNSFRFGKSICSAILLGLSTFAGLISDVHAQAPGKTYRIAVLAYDQNRSSLDPFFDELNRLGYEQNAKIELWNAQGRADKLPALVEEIRRFNPDVVLASATPAALAAKKLMPSTPVVFYTSLRSYTVGPGGKLCQSWRKSDRPDEHEH